MRKHGPPISELSPACDARVTQMKQKDTFSFPTPGSVEHKNKYE